MRLNVREHCFLHSCFMVLVQLSHAISRFALLDFDRLTHTGLYANQSRFCHWQSCFGLHICRVLPSAHLLKQRLSAPVKLPCPLHTYSDILVKRDYMGSIIALNHMHAPTHQLVLYLTILKSKLLSSKEGADLHSSAQAVQLASPKKHS